MNLDDFCNLEMIPFEHRQKFKRWLGKTANDDSLIREEWYQFWYRFVQQKLLGKEDKK